VPNQSKPRLGSSPKTFGLSWALLAYFGLSAPIGTYRHLSAPRFFSFPRSNQNPLPGKILVRLSRDRSNRLKAVVASWHPLKPQTPACRSLGHSRQNHLLFWTRVGTFICPFARRPFIDVPRIRRWVARGL